MVMPWLTAILAVILLIAVAIGWFQGGRMKPAESATPVAHTAQARQHHRFRERLRLFRGALVGTMALVLVVGAITAYLSGRPREVVELENKLATRDIVLCLDVSGSVIEFDGEVLESFEGLLDGFHGERIALVIFDSAARTIFPLTDDYDMVREQLQLAQDALDIRGSGYTIYPSNPDAFSDFVSGTEVAYRYGSSLIGDGLASCTFAFDMDDETRSRSVILATDNELAGTPIYTLDEAAELAKDFDVTVHGLQIETQWSFSSNDMEEAIVSNGGYHYSASDVEAAQSIIDNVQSQDAQDLGVIPETVDADRPGAWPAILAVLLLGLLAMAWRFRL